MKFTHHPWKGRPNIGLSKQNEINALYRKGYSFARIARNVGVCVTTVKKYVVKEV